MTEVGEFSGSAPVGRKRQEWKNVATLCNETACSRGAVTGSYVVTGSTVNEQAGAGRDRAEPPTGTIARIRRSHWEQLLRFSNGNSKTCDRMPW